MKNDIRYNVIIFITLLVGFFFVSCSNTKKECNNIEVVEKEVVTLYTYYIGLHDNVIKRLQRCELAYLDTDIFLNRKIWIFAVDDSLSIDYSYSIENDSLFILGDNSKFIYCPNMTTTNLVYNNVEIEVIKSNFYELKSCDGAMYVYWNNNDGIIAFYNYPWSILTLVERKKVKGFATQTFYDYFIEEQIRSLPPPP